MYGGLKIKKFKKVLAVFMSVLAMAGGSLANISVLPDMAVTVSAEETYGDFEYEVLDDSTVYIHKYTGSAEKVDVPSEIDGKTVTVIDESAFQECKSITKVTVPDSVTDIRRFAFYDCPNLKSVHIGGGVAEIAKNAFIGCSELAEINVDENNQNFLSDEGVLFSKSKDTIVKCPVLKEGSYVIPDGVQTIEENAFMACKDLTEIKIPHTVTEIGDSAFMACTSLAEVKIPDTLTKINTFAFWGCESLASIDIPVGVLEIGSGAFTDCTGLTNVNIADSVTMIDSAAFSGCAGLSGIYIGSGVTEIDKMAFYQCENISDVYFGGNEEQWNSIDIQSNNDTLKNASIHYNAQMPEEMPHQTQTDTSTQNNADIQTNTAAPNSAEIQTNNITVTIIVIISVVLLVGAAVIIILVLKGKG